MLYSAIFIGVMQVVCCTCIGMVRGTKRLIQLAIQGSYISSQQAITPIPHKATGLGIIDALFALCPKPVAQFVTISIVLTSFLANVSQFFATSRFFWALARDKAIPMGKMWRKVTSDRRPVRATFLMIGLSMLFSLVSLDPTDLSLRIFGSSSTFMLLVSSYY
jgi:amino acid transporter